MYFFKVSITLSHPLQVPPPTPPASANDMPESSSKQLSRPRRKRSMRRGTAEIQTTLLPDPEYQRDTVESTQGRLDQEYNFLYNLVKVRERSSIQNINCLLSYVGGCIKMTDYYTEKDIQSSCILKSDLYLYWFSDKDKEPGGDTASSSILQQLP